MQIYIIAKNNHYLTKKEIKVANRDEAVKVAQAVYGNLENVSIILIT